MTELLKSDLIILTFYFLCTKTLKDFREGFQNICGSKNNFAFRNASSVLENILVTGISKQKFLEL